MVFMRMKNVQIGCRTCPVREFEDAVVLASYWKQTWKLNKRD
jgi:hypothetical protein